MEVQRTRSEILAVVDEAEASLAHGDGCIITQQSVQELAEQVKQRGRARLAARGSRPLLGIQLTEGNSIRRCRDEIHRKL